MRTKQRLRRQVLALSVEIAKLEAVLMGPDEGVFEWRAERKAVLSLMARFMKAEEIFLLGPYPTTPAPRQEQP